MSARKIVLTIGLIISCFLPQMALSDDTIAKDLGWVKSDENHCGGYYLEPSFAYPVQLENGGLIETTGQQGFFSFHGTSVLEGKVTINRAGQQITANKAFLYRDPATGKINAIDLIGDVHLREPNTLIIGKEGHYNFQTNAKSLTDATYRTTMLLKNKAAAPTPPVSQAATQKARKVTGLTAWGKAYQFSQTQPKVYDLTNVSYTTCPPTNPIWHVQASHMVLNKNTGRGYATHARILIKNIPVFYTPYINFPIDNRRQTGFLWPRFGISNKQGPYFQAPFYWNMAPNYDMTITPNILTKRGIQLSDNFRYLTETSSGNIDLSVLPHDQFFSDFQTASKEQFSDSTDPTTQSELNRLLSATSTRTSFFWRDNSQYNDHWSSHVDFNYASDDYYLQDFGSGLNESTQNQLLQQGDLYYKSDHWNFTGRVQGYQTLNPITENGTAVATQYRRLPELVLSGDYPDQAYGLEYFIDNDITHFDILKTPGATTIPPIGNRINVQPGFNLPLYWPYFYMNPRFQVALTDYNLQQVSDTDTPASIHRAVPIFDVATGLSLYRNINLFGQGFQQTLEPQIYYTYIPYRDQSDIPIFDTNVTTLTYDQLFNYNRFSGLDRIGDANQISAGLTTRLIDRETGLEKVRAAIGEIVYFADRRVTLCNSASECSDYPGNPVNSQRLSPASGTLDYHVNPVWKVSGNAIWNPTTKQVDNSTIGLNYQPDPLRAINLGYGFARNGDPFSGVSTGNTSDNNLKLTDFSFSWPLTRDISSVGRWSHDWNTNHFQDLIYGVQYDACCWAVRIVASRTFVGVDPSNNNTLLYDSGFYIQFALKGLGNVGSGDPTSLLSTIGGYNTQFGQEY
ncbi:MAG: LPS-assembly protein LptD [Gammaproteobacteria bacterium]|nr:MAG: LPS-assembly protein LptD [Gammaproteobacteria bacterium]